MKFFFFCLLLTYSSACVFGSNNLQRWRRASSAFWTEKRNTHAGRVLDSQDIQRLSGLSDVTHFNVTLSNILIPRVPGTLNHSIVRQFIHGELENLGWTVEEHSFDDSTPLGKKRFTNIIATLNPIAPRRLVIACHYESKLDPPGFVGAIDSAVPCSMMINLAHTMKHYLHPNSYKEAVTLQFIFFDGEEAFVRWTSKDSLYGSRRLAGDWQKTPYPGSSGSTELDRIDLFVLLDLLGTNSTRFVKFSTETERWYDVFAKIESQLNFQRNSRKILFQNFGYGGEVQDDHVPFQKRGVPILHLISAPFPSVWHEMSDNVDALDFETIEHFNVLLRAFVAHYLRIDV